MPPYRDEGSNPLPSAFLLILTDEGGIQAQVRFKRLEISTGRGAWAWDQELVWFDNRGFGSLLTSCLEKAYDASVSDSEIISGIA